jgi:arabinose-5-phosphate isomerase
MHCGDKLPLVQAGASTAQAILEMTSKGFGCTGVVDGAGQLVGIVTDGDLRRHMASGLLEQTAEAIMTAAPRTIAGPELLSEALRRMTAHKISAIFVVEEAAPIGIVHLHDCLRVGIA